MSEAEARRLLAAEISDLRSLSYEQLRERVPRVRWTIWFLKSVDGEFETTREVTAESGLVYTLATAVFWDAADDQDIRVLCTIDGGDTPVSKPISESFIRAPDGSFVGE